MPFRPSVPSALLLAFAATCSLSSRPVSSFVTTASVPERPDLRRLRRVPASSFSLPRRWGKTGEDHESGGNPLCRMDEGRERAVARSDRRHWLKKALAASAVAAVIPPPREASATASPPGQMTKKSRSEGYAVRRTRAEWTELLSGAQYDVLRRGGTERQRSSVLENEKRPGTFRCAGCGTILFVSNSKFQSGTGWPSFEEAVEGAVEIENVDTFRAAVDGAEVRCRTCGGHLGDVFGDGWRFRTRTGKRYCINGASLVFRPESGEKELRGDRPPPNKVIEYEPALRRENVS